MVTRSRAHPFESSPTEPKTERNPCRDAQYKPLRASVVEDNAERATCKDLAHETISVTRVEMWVIASAKL
jgi:hypothetical protein